MDVVLNQKIKLQTFGVPKGNCGYSFKDTQDVEVSATL